MGYANAPTSTVVEALSADDYHPCMLPWRIQILSNRKEFHICTTQVTSYRAGLHVMRQELIWWESVFLPLLTEGYVSLNQTMRNTVSKQVNKRKEEGKHTLA